MKLKNLIAFLIFFLASFGNDLQAQCTILGNAPVCVGATLQLTGSGTPDGTTPWVSSTPLVATVDNTGLITGVAVGTTTITYLDDTGCSITADVTVYPLPVPTILSSEGNPICTNPGGSTLSLANPYDSYDWGFGITTPTFFAPGAGAYAVTVVDANGCAGQNVITLTDMAFNLTSTATSGCYGAFTTLQASGGGTYLWSTGETGSSIVVNPAASTIYSVTITNGTCVETLTSTVVPVEGIEWEMPDTIYLGVGEQEAIEGPPGFDSYLWAPTSLVNNPFSSTAIVTGSTTQVLTLEATHPTGCILYDQAVIIVVDLSIPEGFSPNGDSWNQIFTIPELTTEEFNASIQVWNRWGELVLDEENYKNTWEGTCETTLCIGNEQLPEGTYFYHIDAKGVIFEGYITLKR